MPAINCGRSASPVLEGVTGEVAGSLGQALGLYLHVLDAYTWT